ncbi:hypothetical protein [Caulobacter sp. LjRoot300]|uniref:hypothetical protein n=1 Tax=Caulobacter sp. LjRoot300 TaxID=3342321 RepID=UPI003ED09F28
MWNLIRCLVVMLALAGFVGQTTARATPMMMDQVASTSTQAAPAMMNCADMPGMSDMAKAATPASPIKAPCKGMTHDCVGKMGCSTFASPLPASIYVAGSVIYGAVTFANADQTREGLASPLLYHPPKQLA